MKRRVVVTGIGCLTPLGEGVERLRQGLRACRSPIRFLSRFDTTLYRSKCAGEIEGFDAGRYFPPHRLKRLDRYGQFSLVVAAQALADAGIVITGDKPEPRKNFGISFGTALGGITNAEFQHEKFLKEGPEAIPPALALQVFGGSGHSNIAIAFGFRGYATTNSNSCASGTVAVGEAFRSIQRGDVDVMVAGAAEAPLGPLTFGAFDGIKSMSTERTDPSRACRPFDRDRTGFVMAEGGAALILEEYEHAIKRKARIYAEVCGYSLNNDAFHMTSSLPDGAAVITAMQQALDEAKMRPGEVEYINAHASSTPMNDEHEARAIRTFFGSQTPLVSGTKAFYGHALGAAGAVEAAICALTLADGFIPPTLNCDNPEVPDGLRLVLGKGLEQKVSTALSNSFGFGGINAVLAMRRLPENAG